MNRALLISLAGNAILACACSILFFSALAKAPPPHQAPTLTARSVSPARDLTTGGGDSSAPVSVTWSLGPSAVHAPSDVVSQPAGSSASGHSTGSVVRSQSGGLSAAPTSGGHANLAAVSAPDSTPVPGRSISNDVSSDSTPRPVADLAGGPPMAPGMISSALQPARGPTYPAAFVHRAAMDKEAAQKGASPRAPAGAAAVSPQEEAVLDAINTGFVSAIGGEGQNPDDPVYQARWDAAQQLSDAQYKKFFGGRAYVRHQIEAARQAALEQQAAGSAQR